jgi:hypothetical protein
LALWPGAKKSSPTSTSLEGEVRTQQLLRGVNAKLKHCLPKPQRRQAARHLSRIRLSPLAAVIKDRHFSPHPPADCGDLNADVQRAPSLPAALVFRRPGSLLYDRNLESHL